MRRQGWARRAALWLASVLATISDKLDEWGEPPLPPFPRLGGTFEPFRIGGCIIGQGIQGRLILGLGHAHIPPTGECVLRVRVASVFTPERLALSGDLFNLQVRNDHMLDWMPAAAFCESAGQIGAQWRTITPGGAFELRVRRAR